MGLFEKLKTTRKVAEILNNNSFEYLCSAIRKEGAEYR
jgi:hypothetical protein